MNEYIDKYQAISKGNVKTGQLSNQIRRLLRSIDHVGWSTHEEAGRLDRRALTRFASGDAAIFSRRHYKEAERSAVMVMIDCSGSMDQRIKEAQKTSIYLSEILSDCKVPFAVYGFGDHCYGGLLTVNHKFFEGPTFLKFKEWGERLSKAQAKLGFMHKTANGGTPDYPSLYWGIDEVSRRPEQRKVLFFITDANGYEKDHIQHLERMAEKLGVILVVIGICSGSVDKVFTKSVSIYSASELSSTVFKQFIWRLTK